MRRRFGGNPLETRKILSIGANPFHLIGAGEHDAGSDGDGHGGDQGPIGPGTSP